jgi:homoserine O-acetyltransferase/O-succinyltransferase
MCEIMNNQDSGDMSYYTFDGMTLESGEKLRTITLAYETWGALNNRPDNAVLICHALSGDAHASGISHPGAPGWWEDMIGPGKAFDTDRYFVICSNVLGGCQGSTGPSSLNPSTTRPYGLDFPIITIGDMVAAQARLLDHLGIERLLAVAGGSMGGMQALSWGVKYPERAGAVIAIATTTRHSPQQIAFNEVGRQAILSDTAFNGGQYYDTGKAPHKGLAMARMVGHITYMSDQSMEEKFGRRFRESLVHSENKFTGDFEVSSYLRHKGDSFVKRFDANSYLYITRAVDLFDLTGGQKLEDALRPCKDLSFLVLAFKSDWLYPASQSKELVRGCKLAGVDVTYCELNSNYGHDAFLLETDEETRLVGGFLRRLYQQRRTEVVSLV